MRIELMKEPFIPHFVLLQLSNPTIGSAEPYPTLSLLKLGCILKPLSLIIKGPVAVQSEQKSLEVLRG